MRLCVALLSQKAGVVATSSPAVSSRAVATVLARTRDVATSSTSPGRTSNSWSVDKPPPARPTAVQSTAVPPRPGDHGPHRPGDTGSRRLVDLGPRLGDQGAGRLVRRGGDETLAVLDSLAAETRALSQTINVNKTSTSSVSSRPPPGRAITRAQWAVNSRLSAYLQESVLK